MLEEEQVVVGRAGEQRTLERVGISIVDPSEPACS
jgi:hypothetical protein